jgi:putative endopeptidase
MSNATGSVLGEAVGQLYVEKYFPPEAKVRMDKLVTNLKSSLRGRIEKLEWMSEETRVQALAKLDAFGVKIGYPEKWEDYSKLEVSTDSYIQNTWRASQFSIVKNMAKLGQPVDTEKWGMTPQTVNAYYHPLLNEVVFPAAILQPPFFYMNGDDAVNYGAIGVVIGHEMTHGFDNSGRRFDKDGNMKDWWTAEDTDKFNDRTQKLIDQFDGFKAFDDLNVDGTLTLGENIADYGGLTVSLEAYKMSLNGKKPADIDEFNNMQRFFLAYSKVWRGNIRDTYLRKLIKEDVHSPGKYRVNGGLFNIPEFYTAFDINETDPLYRNEEQRAKIW